MPNQSDILNANLDWLQAGKEEIFPKYEINNHKTIHDRIEEAKRSTFDHSKFTVVGTPTITDDGIASGFSGGSYLKANISELTNATNFKIAIKCKIFDIINYGYVLSDAVSSAEHGIAILQQNGAFQFRQGSTFVNLARVVNNDDLEMIITVKNSTLAHVVCYQNVEKVYDNDIVMNMQNWTGSLFIGTRPADEAGSKWRGSIDLKQFSITVDGKEVFNGNKTGIDQIKKNDYTVVGSPVISDNGIFNASLQANNYVKMPALSTFTDDSYKSIVFKTRIKMSKNFIPTSQTGIIAGRFWASYETTKGQIGLRAQTPNNIWLFSVPATLDGEWIDIIWEANSNGIRGGYKTVNVDTYTYGNYVQGNLSLNNDFILFPNINQEMSIGQIDLNNTKIYINDQLVYQPTLRIPYTLASNGAKIVDSVYRNRVQDMYEQFDYTNYYTLGETDYTLATNEFITKQDVIQDLEQIRTNANLVITKQDIINDLSTIRANAKAGADIVPQVNINTQRIEDLTTARIPDVIYHGTPKITGGQITNFSTVNYLQFPFEDISRSLPFDIYFSFTTDADVTTQQNIIDSRFGIALALQNGKGVMALSSNGTNWDIGSVIGTNTLLPNTTYYVKYSWTGTEYNASLSTNAQTYVPDMILASNKSPYKTTIYIGGCDQEKTGHTPHPFKGIINFTKSRVVVNGITVWEGMADVGIASRANVSLNNLDEVGEARFNAKQDKLTQGSAISLEDDVVAVELFDKSKFTVVDTPNINEDGVVSGFGSNGRLEINNIGDLLKASDNWVIELPIITGNDFYTSRQEILGGSINSAPYGLIVRTWFNSRKIGIYINGVSNTDNLSFNSVKDFQDNTKYMLKIVCKDKKVKLYVDGILDNERDITENVNFNSTIRLGVSINTGNYFQGSIDLSQFSITIDDVEVFNGTQTIYQALDKKQDVITDLAIIRDGASKGATALQNTNDCVHKTGDETINGVKTFNGGTGGNNVAIKAPNGIAIGSTTQTAYSQYATIRNVNNAVNTGSYYIDGNGSVLFRHKTGSSTAEGSANDAMFTINPVSGIKAGFSGTAGKGITDSDLHDVLIDTVNYTKLNTTAKDVLGAINEVNAKPIGGAPTYIEETETLKFGDN